MRALRVGIKRVIIKRNAEKITPKKNILVPVKPPSKIIKCEIDEFGQGVIYGSSPFAAYYWFLFYFMYKLCALCLT